MVVLVVLAADVCLIFFFKQKTAYEVRISDWSSDVCSSDLNFAEVRLDEAGAAGSIRRVRIEGVADGDTLLARRTYETSRHSGPVPGSNSPPASSPVEAWMPEHVRHDDEMETE